MLRVSTNMCVCCYHLEYMFFLLCVCLRSSNCFLVLSAITHLCCQYQPVYNYLYYLELPLCMFVVFANQSAFMFCSSTSIHVCVCCVWHIVTMYALFINQQFIIACTPTSSFLCLSTSALLCCHDQPVQTLVPFINES